MYTNISTHTQTQTHKHTTHTHTHTHSQHSTPSTYLCASRSACLRAATRDALTGHAAVTAQPARRSAPPASSIRTSAALSGMSGVGGATYVSGVGGATYDLVPSHTRTQTDSLNSRSSAARADGSSLLRLSSSNVSFTASRNAPNEVKSKRPHHKGGPQLERRCSDGARLGGGGVGGGGQERQAALTHRGQEGLLVVGGGAAASASSIANGFNGFNGFMAASPNEEARIAREAAVFICVRA